MADLDTLRPEVQAAMRTMDGQAGGNRDDAYDVIEAELLRLAGENAELREQPKMPAVAWQQRTEQAEAELAAMKARFAAAPIAVVSPSGTTNVMAEVPRELAGKRVRLLVE